MSSFRRNSVKTYSPRGPRTFDELVAFQSVKRGTHNRTFIADKPCNLVGAGEACSVTIDESEQIPISK